MRGAFFKMGRYLGTFSGVFLLVAVVLGDDKQLINQETPAPGLFYWCEKRTQPRPLVIYNLRLDLRRKRWTLAVKLTPDPDGAGPAMARLEKPISMAKKSDFFAAVNCISFGSIGANPGPPLFGWYLDQPVKLYGLAVEHGVVRNPPQSGYIPFWLDRQGEPHLGNPVSVVSVKEGIAGFGWLMRDGRECGPQGPQNPRTAIGLDQKKKTLWLVVVDGRQPGYSEGMSTAELAAYMHSLGCWDAVNFDGGGSSVMILADKKGRLRVMNRPSTRMLGISVTRPVPALLGIRLSEKSPATPKGREREKAQ